jgi:ATP-dependent protease HslVU (ClpYQ) peptidase subunit
MSTVVGLKTKNGVWIGADSRASTEEGEIRPVVANKIITNGPYLIGFIGSVRGGQIIRKEYFKPPKDPFDWPDALIEQCQKKSCIATGDPQTAIMLCNYLVADYRSGKLYEILIDFQMNEIEEMTAIGSGSPFAFGSLFTTRELNIKGEERVMYALQAAATFDSATGAPFIVHKLKRRK